jgi:hypothetical protein
MIDSFSDHGYSWDGSTGVNLLASGVGLADRPRPPWCLLADLRKGLYVKFYQLPKQLFQTKTLALASDHKHSRLRLQTVKLEPIR